MTYCRRGAVCQSMKYSGDVRRNWTLVTATGSDSSVAPRCEVSGTSYSSACVWPSSPV
jgi:hypothetical protein